ncbi:MAG: VanZ family protein [Lachnospiraceae bacterium]|nr:VanZ family protein [Lachnospiraceae bacterium]
MEMIGAIRHYLFPSLVSAVVICAVWFLVCRLMKKKTTWQEWVCRLFLMTLVSAMFIITGGYQIFTGGFSTFFVEPNLVPIIQTAEYFTSNPEAVVEQALYNIALFIPFGFLLPMSFGKGSWRLWKVLVVTVAVILAIELLELFTGRYFDIDDFFVNGIGAAIGYAIYKIARMFYHDDEGGGGGTDSKKQDEIKKQNDDMTVINTIFHI